MASAPRDRDDHVCAGGERRTWRQPRKPRCARSRRRAVDDRGERNSPPGNAAGRCARAHAWLPAVGQLALVAKDDSAALPGHQGGRDSRDRGRRRDARPRHLRRVWGRRGPVEGVAADPRYVDVWVPPGRRKILPVETGRHAFDYICEGSGTFGSASQPFGVLTEKAGGGNELLIRERTGNRSLVVFDSDDEVTVQAGEEGIRFLLVSGKPIEEPVAWYGPIVMNTEAELQQAFTELNKGTFIKQR